MIPLLECATPIPMLQPDRHLVGPIHNDAETLAPRAMTGNMPVLLALFIVAVRRKQMRRMDKEEIIAELRRLAKKQGSRRAA